MFSLHRRGSTPRPTKTVGCRPPRVQRLPPMTVRLWSIQSSLKGNEMTDARGSRKRSQRGMLGLAGLLAVVAAVGRTALLATCGGDDSLPALTTNACPAPELSVYIPPALQLPDRAHDTEVT